MLGVFESLDVRMERAVLSYLPVCADILDNQKPSPLFDVHPQKMAEKPVLVCLSCAGLYWPVLCCPGAVSHDSIWLKEAAVCFPTAPPLHS